MQGDRMNSNMAGGAMPGGAMPGGGMLGGMPGGMVPMNMGPGFMGGNPSPYLYDTSWAPIMSGGMMPGSAAVDLTPPGPPDRVWTWSGAEREPPAKGTAVVLPVPEDRLWYWNIGMSIFHATFGFVALGVGKRDLRVPLYSSNLGLEVLQDRTDGWAYRPELPVRVGWLHLTVLVASFSLLSAVAHLGNSLLWRTQYIASLKSGYAPFRWLEYCFSASVMILLLAYISGTVFESTLVLLFALTMTTMAFGHLHEVICRPKSLEEWDGSLLWRLQAHLLGYIPQFFAWGVVVANFLNGANASTIDSSGEKRQMPDFVYGIVFGELLIFWSFGLVQLIVTMRPPSKYYQGELAYMWLSLFAKGFLAILCLANVIMSGGYAEIYETDGQV